MQIELKNGENEGLNPSKVKIGQLPRWAWLLAVLTAAVLWAGISVHHWYLGLRPVDLGSPSTWTSLETKQKIADSLAQIVTLPDFRVGVHLVQRGENYWGIARDGNINIDTLVGFNPELENLQAWLEQPLMMSNTKGSLVLAKRGDSLRTIAIRAGMEAKTIAEANRLPWYGLREGQLLFLPGARPAMLSAAMKDHYGKRSIFRSPLQGSYSSLKGNRSDPFTGSTKHHNGVDIRADYNEPVAAAAGGKVIFAGWKNGYGKTVIIDHAEDYRSLYGHLNSIQVKHGARVQRHQFIGLVGATGRATGPHLHFTIWHKGKLKDPLQFLW